nr:hypothetical protein [Arthrobacter alpinus]
MARKHLGKVLIAFFIALTGARLMSALELVSIGGLLNDVLPLAIAFLAGALLHVYAEKVKVNSITVSAAVILLAVSTVLNLAPALAHLPSRFC